MTSFDDRLGANASGPGPDVEFAKTWGLVDGIPGWLTREQAHMLDAAARGCPRQGRIVEIGSFQGRSTIVLARAAGPEVTVIAIDPHAGTDRGPGEMTGYDAAAADDHQAFRTHLDMAGVSDLVEHHRMFSQDALSVISGSVDVLYVDGAHRFGPARADLVHWGDKVREGGVMLVHDAFSSVGVTLALFTGIVGRRRWRYVGRRGSLVRFDADRPRGFAPVVREILRAAAQMPYFARNLGLKVVLSVGGGRLWERCGREVPPWPY